ncbi:MAG: hypothetical protein QM730_20780 [Anaerolineales bacterium]
MKHTRYFENISNFFCISLGVIIFLTGCSSYIESQEVKPTSPPALAATTENKLLQPIAQLTYIKNQENSGSMYGVDITCLSNVKICAKEPVLLFRTLSMPNASQYEPKGLLTDYSWSPSGKEIVLVSAGDLLIGSFSGDTVKWTNVTKSPDIDELEPEWSSDGNFIYYIECIDNSAGMCSPKLVRTDRLGKNKLYLLSKQDTSMTSFGISSDGQKIIFTATDKEGYEQIYKASQDGADIHQITFGDFDNTSPSFSPDGKELIFVRSSRLEYIDAKPEFEIVLKNLGTGLERNLIEKHAGDASAPIFSPDGKWIIFTIWDDNLMHNIYLLALDQISLFQLTQDNEGAFPAWRFITK